MSSSEHVKTIQFDRTRRAYCFFTTKNTTPQDIIEEFRLNPLPNGIICISGGAALFPPDTIKTTVRLVEFAIAPGVFNHDLIVIDGGTECGIMQITGMILRKVKYGNSLTLDQSQNQLADFETLPLMGFVPESKVIYPGIKRSDQDYPQIDPNHTYIVMVTEAQDWGDEVECMFSFLEYLSGEKKIPVTNIIANGGRVTIEEAYHAVQQGYHIIVLEGSARATEVIVAALNKLSKKDLVTLLKHHKLANQTQEEETLFWLEAIAQYNKITRFDFWSSDYYGLKRLILSSLGC